MTLGDRCAGRDGGAFGQVLQFTTRSQGQTVALGERIGKLLKPGYFVALIGPLGSGKTYFTKGLAKGLGVEDETSVVSPSFTLVNVYHGRVPVLHVDAYRLHGEKEYQFLDIESFGPVGKVVILEWADKVWDSLPAEMLVVRFEALSLTVRRITIECRGRKHLGVMLRLRSISVLSSKLIASPRRRDYLQ